MSYYQNNEGVVNGILYNSKKDSRMVADNDGHLLCRKAYSDAIPLLFRRILGTLHLHPDIFIDDICLYPLPDRDTAVSHQKPVHRYCHTYHHNGRHRSHRLDVRACTDD